MLSANIYLNFPGNTEEAFDFYKSVFGGEFAGLMRYKDSPEAGNTKPEDLDKVFHVALPLGNGNVLMGTDATGQHVRNLVKGNNFHISLSPDSEAEARRLFDGLSAGGNLYMPLSKMFWGALFGMFTDKYGIQWMVNYENR